MAKRSGSADLPLHSGHVPAWLHTRMARLGALISQAIVHHYGRDEFLRRLSHPFWFQSFGAIMGMDWHSSGITTSVIGALKRGLKPLDRELGLHVCGGKGQHSRRTPQELLLIAERAGFDGNALGLASRLVAKVDSAAVQDGFDLYLHGFVVSDDGQWTVIQQGMNTDTRQARRYHWHSEGLKDFVEEPHAAIDGTSQGTIINLTDRRASLSRNRQVDLTNGSPDAVITELQRISGKNASVQLALPHLTMPARHAVGAGDVKLRRLHATLVAAANRGPADFSQLLLIPGVGARTVQSLAMVAKVVHGAPCRFQDPARFSLAHGGKDRHPFPVPLRVYEETIRVMKSAVENGKLGREEELSALKRLDAETRRVEAFAKVLHSKLLWNVSGQTRPTTAGGRSAALAHRLSDFSGTPQRRHPRFHGRCGRVGGRRCCMVCSLRWWPATRRTRGPAPALGLAWTGDAPLSCELRHPTATASWLSWQRQNLCDLEAEVSAAMAAIGT